jgi:hypothetical protein
MTSGRNQNPEPGQGLGWSLYPHAPLRPGNRNLSKRKIFASSLKANILNRKEI